MKAILRSQFFAELALALIRRSCAKKTRSCFSRSCARTQKVLRAPNFAEDSRFWKAFNPLNHNGFAPVERLCTYNVSLIFKNYC